MSNNNVVEYNESCPLCHWKFYVDPKVAGDGYNLVKLTCIKCGSVWMHAEGRKIGTE